jgi:AcrR family transcriptional regulator
MAGVSRRERVVAAALRLAAEGYDAVHIRTVASLAGVAPSTVYQYFASKDDLLVASLHHWLTVCGAEGRVRLHGIGDSYARLRHLADFLIERLWAEPLFADAVTRAYLCADSVAAANADRVRTTMSHLLTSAMSLEHPTLRQRQIGELVADLWAATMLSVVQNRMGADDSRARLRKTIAMIARHDTEQGLPVARAEAV